ncbi:hypothetical protein ACQEVF_53230 [Nonomuraea polychroma]|uniref:hypothetical protein n=1 Tax=Nonomuraea polychroma TaxID=46176 RepID=UPI003D942AE0
MSLIVVLTALPARLAAVPLAELAAHWAVAVNLLAGSLLGAWAGASWAVRMRTACMYVAGCQQPERVAGDLAGELVSQCPPIGWAPARGAVELPASRVGWVAHRGDPAGGPGGDVAATGDLEADDVTGGDW